MYCQIYLTVGFKLGHVTTTSPDEVYLSYFMITKTYVVCTHRDSSFGDQYQNRCSLSDNQTKNTLKILRALF